MAIRVYTPVNLLFVTSLKIALIILMTSQPVKMYDTVSKSSLRGSRSERFSDSWSYSSDLPRHWYLQWEAVQSMNNEWLPLHKSLNKLQKDKEW